jgi:hypothetical protein
LGILRDGVDGVFVEEVAEGQGAVVVVEGVVARVNGVELDVDASGFEVENGEGIGRGVGRVGGAREVAGAGELEEGAGGAEGDAMIFGADLPLEDADGVGEGAAELVGSCAVDFLAAAVQLGLEDVVVESPAGDGDAVEVEGGGGPGVGAAGDEKVDGGELLGGERFGVGGEELAAVEVGVGAWGFGEFGDRWRGGLNRLFNFRVVAGCSVL